MRAQTLCERLYVHISQNPLHTAHHHTRGWFASVVLVGHPPQPPIQYNGIESVVHSHTPTHTHRSMKAFRQASPGLSGHVLNSLRYVIRAHFDEIYFSFTVKMAIWAPRHGAPNQSAQQQ